MENLEMTEQEDKNKRKTPREQAHGQKTWIRILEINPATA